MRSYRTVRFVAALLFLVSFVCFIVGIVAAVMVARLGLGGGWGIGWRGWVWIPVFVSSLFNAVLLLVAGSVLWFMSRVNNNFQVAQARPKRVVQVQPVVEEAVPTPAPIVEEVAPPLVAVEAGVAGVAATEAQAQSRAVEPEIVRGPLEQPLQVEPVPPEAGVVATAPEIAVPEVSETPVVMEEPMAATEMPVPIEIPEVSPVEFPPAEEAPAVPETAESEPPPVTRESGISRAVETAAGAAVAAGLTPAVEPHELTVEEAIAAAEAEAAAEAAAASAAEAKAAAAGAAEAEAPEAWELKAPSVEVQVPQVATPEEAEARTIEESAATMETGAAEALQAPRAPEAEFEEAASRVAGVTVPTVGGEVRTPAGEEKWAEAVEAVAPEEVVRVEPAEVPVVEAVPPVVVTAEEPPAEPVVKMDETPAGVRTPASEEKWAEAVEAGAPAAAPEEISAEVGAPMARLEEIAPEATMDISAEGPDQGVSEGGLENGQPALAEPDTERQLPGMNSVARVAEEMRSLGISPAEEPAQGVEVAEEAPSATTEASATGETPTESFEAAEPQVSENVAPTRAALPDDLTAIKGIGFIFAQRLHAAGITTFADLANASDELLERLTDGNLERVIRDDWRGQARRLASS